MKRQKRKVKDQAVPTPTSTEKSSWLSILKNPKVSWALALGASLLLCLFFFLYHVRDWQAAKNACFYEGKPTMATFDAYYFMRLTDDYLNGNYTPEDPLRGGALRPMPAPLLVRIAGFIRSLTGSPLEYIAWLLPPFLATLTVLIYAYWARFFQNPLLLIISSIIGSTSYIWFWRTSLGRFDTDSLNLLFPGVLSASIFLFLTASNITKKLAALIGIIVCVFLWYLWWPQGYNLGLILAIGTYGISVFFVPGNRLEKALRIGILVACLIVAAFLGLYALNRSIPIPAFLKPIAGYADLIFRSEPSEPPVGASITELQSLPMLKAATQMFGFWWLIIPAIIGVILTVIARPFFVVLWVPFLALGTMGFFSNRFLIFLVPPLAFGLAFLPTVWFIQTNRFSWTGAKWKWAIGLTIAVIFALPNIITNLRIAGMPNVTAGLVHIAKMLEPIEPKDSTVWTWWDYGYLLQYYAKKKTFIDGGMQGPPRITVAAYGFAVDNVVTAKNWINCFAHNDLMPLERAKQELGSEAKAFAFLKEALSGQDNLKEVIQKYHQEHNEQLWHTLLFPKTRAFLFIPVDFFRKSYWWYYYGSWDYERNEGIHPQVIFFHRWFVNLNLNKGYLTTLDGRKAFFKRYVIAENGRHPKEITVASEPSTTLILTVPGLAILFGENVYESTALKLYLHPEEYRNTFEPLYYHPAYGGIWRTIP
jgi:hypothetical protein